MASSKKPPPDLLAHVAHVLSRQIQPAQHLVLGLSGGVDSVVLLDILVQLRTSLHFHLSAIHVNHQLSPHASEWAAFCTRLCQQHDVPLEVIHVTVAAAGNSLEAAARHARHEALARSDADYIILAHHLDDQSETLLLHLLRGSGVAGASAMAERNQRLLRPLLEIPRSALEHHARQYQLAWVEDESNANTRFERNFLRHRVLPVIAEHFPAYRTTLSRASRHFAESTQLLDELAQLDSEDAIHDNRLAIAALSRLSPPRARNLLRHYLKQHGIPAPSTLRLEEALRQLLHGREDCQIRLNLGSIELRRFLGHVWLVAPPAAPPPDFCQTWEGEREIRLPQLGGALHFRDMVGQGISLARLQQNKVTIRLRQGRERLQPDCKRPHRSLKNLCQEAAIPPWVRPSLPLLFSGEDLVAMAAIGTDCAFQARPGEPGIMLEWLGQDAHGQVFFRPYHTGI